MNIVFIVNEDRQNKKVIPLPGLTTESQGEIMKLAFEIERIANEYSDNNILVECVTGRGTN